MENYRRRNLRGRSFKNQDLSHEDCSYSDIRGTNFIHIIFCKIIIERLYFVSFALP